MNEEKTEAEEAEVERYSIKKTLSDVGYIYPVLEDAQGRVIDGHHRLAADPNWPVYKLPGIKTDAQFLMATLIANFHRRTMPKEEKTDMLDAIAKETNWSPTEIAEKMGLSYRTVMRYISDDYKDKTFKDMREKQIKEQRKKLAASVAARREPSSKKEEGHTPVKPEEENPLEITKPIEAQPTKDPKKPDPRVESKSKPKPTPNSCGGTSRKAKINFPSIGMQVDLPVKDAKEIIKEAMKNGHS